MIFRTVSNIPEGIDAYYVVGGVRHPLTVGTTNSNSSTTFDPAGASEIRFDVQQGYSVEKVKATAYSEETFTFVPISFIEDGNSYYRTDVAALDKGRIEFTLVASALETKSITINVKGVGIKAEVDKGYEVVELIPNEPTLVSGEVDGDWVINIEALDGFIIEEVKDYKYFDPDDLQYHTIRFKEVDGVYSYSPANTLPDDVEFRVVSIEDVGSTISPLNRLFQLDESNIVQLSEFLAGIYGDDTSTTSVDNVDSVINLLYLPFEINQVDVSNSDSTVKIGRVTTPIKAPRILSDLVVVDVGSITVVDSVGSAYDYVGCAYELVLPFVEKPIVLDPSQVVGKTISVEYVVDLYDGSISANVYNGGDEPIETETAGVGRDIPVRLFSRVENNLSAYTPSNNGILNAFIRVTRVELVDGEFNNLVEVYDKLSNCTGYVAVEDIDLELQVTADEHSSIVQLLKQGVIIRD